MNRTPDELIAAMEFCLLDGGASVFLMGDNEMARLVLAWREKHEEDESMMTPPHPDCITCQGTGKVVTDKPKVHIGFFDYRSGDLCPTCPRLNATDMEISMIKPISHTSLGARVSRIERHLGLSIEEPDRSNQPTAERIAARFVGGDVQERRDLELAILRHMEHHKLLTRESVLWDILSFPNAIDAKAAIVCNIVPPGFTPEAMRDAVRHYIRAYAELRGIRLLDPDSVQS